MYDFRIEKTTVTLVSSSPQLVEFHRRIMGAARGHDDVVAGLQTSEARLLLIDIINNQMV